MKPEDYAWNEFERTAYKTKMNRLPSPYKVAIWDDSEKRLELEQILERLPQKELARWALENSRDFLSLIDIGDEGEKNKMIRQAYEAFDARLRNEISPHELRKAGFAAISSLKMPKIKSLSTLPESLYKPSRQPI